jgi:hypothetical protein
LGWSIHTPAGKSPPSGKRRFGVFVCLVLLLVGLGIARSAIATRLDGFTIDEAYHIAAGVSYVRYGDFRINPEHPPLVKLWVGSVISATGFQMDALRQFTDKPDERKFTQSLVFQKNDPDSVQQRARAEMFFVNGLLLMALAFALERAFDARVALGALLFLVIDPKVGGFPFLAETLRRAGVTRNLWFLPACESLYLTEQGPVVTQGTPLVTGTVDVPPVRPRSTHHRVANRPGWEGHIPEFLAASMACWSCPLGRNMRLCAL